VSLKNILLLLFLVGNVAFLTAQLSGTISGTISDGEMQEEPLLFANVALKNTLWSAQTNFDGNFEFADVPFGDYTLVVTYLGYETLEMPLTVNAEETTIVQESLAALSMDSKSAAISETKTSPSISESTDDKASKSQD
jgi:hypothetical protein